MLISLIIAILFQSLLIIVQTFDYGLNCFEFSPMCVIDILIVMLL